MSAIAGMLKFGRIEVDRVHLALMSQCLAHLGPDDCGMAIRPGIGMVYRGFKTTLEQRHESQPAGRHGLLLVFDGRLDNRTDLINQLSRIGPVATDVDLIATAFKVWGCEAFRHLEGEFSVVIWDHANERLILARDSFGLRRLFYNLDGTRLLFATTPDAILSQDVPIQVDEEFVAMFLSYYPDGKRSPFRSIVPVEPGTYVEVKETTARVHRFWNIRELATRPPDSRPPHSYEEEFRALFFNAVAVRLRSDCPIAADLSGGLDSSSIVCVADHLASRSSGELPRVRTLSVVYDQARSSDERSFISEVENRRGFPGVHIREDDDPILRAWCDPNFISFPNTDLCFGGLIPGKIKAMKELGSRVLLSGVFGDNVLAVDWQPRTAAKMISEGRLTEAITLCFNYAKASGEPLAMLFWREALRPNLIGGRRSPKPHVPRWLSCNLRKRTDLIVRLNHLTRPPESWCGVSRYPSLLFAIDHMGSGYAENQTSYDCVETRYPYLDRPLVEFLVSLPTDMVARTPERRWLQRSSLKGILPEAIRTRMSKSGPAEAICIAVDREWPKLQDLIATSRACQQGFVEAKELRLDFVRKRHGLSPKADVLRFVALEMWLRALESWPSRLHALRSLSHTTTPFCRRNDSPNQSLI